MGPIAALIGTERSRFALRTTRKWSRVLTAAGLGSPEHSDSRKLHVRYAREDARVIDRKRAGANCLALRRSGVLGQRVHDVADHLVGFHIMLVSLGDLS